MENSNETAQQPAVANDQAQTPAKVSYHDSPEDFRKSLQGVGQDKAISVEEKPEQTEKGQASEKEKPKTSELHPDLLKFISNKQIDPAKLSEPETVQKIIDMARNSETKMNEVLRERELRDAEVKKKKTEQEAQEVLDAGKKKPVEPKWEDLSPTERVEKDTQHVFSILLDTTGCASEEELVGKYPDIYARFQSAINQAEKRAWKEELEWRDKRRGKQSSEETAKAKFQKEWESVQEKAKETFENAKKTDPQILENFKTSGLNDVLDDLARITNIPVEYFVADSRFFTMFSKMAKAMIEVNNLPEKEKGIRKQVEKDIKEAKKAEMVSRSEKLPDDHSIPFKPTGKKSGVSLFD